MDRLLLLTAAVSACCTAASAQDFEAEFPPGLAARITADGATVERIDDNIRLVYESSVGRPVRSDPRLPLAAPTAEWTSLVRIRENSNYRFHVYLQGEVEIAVNGVAILTASSDEPRWISSENVELSFGEADFHCKFKSRPERGRISLFWSSDAFPLEPVPRESFFREEPHPAWRSHLAGRRQLVALRCQACHDSAGGLPVLPAPSLELRKEGLAPSIVIRRLTAAQPIDPTSRMPQFAFDAAEAEAIAAYLDSMSKPVDLDSPPRSKDFDKDVTAGKILVHSRGCLACHKLGDFGNDDLFAGPALDNLASRASPAWIHTWLRHPDKLNSDHRMPQIDLSKDEARQITRYLQTLGNPVVGKPLDGNPATAARGKRLIEAARCANCHRIPGVKPSRAGIVTLDKLSKTKAGCVAEVSKLSKTRPTYAESSLPSRKTLLAFLKEVAASRYDQSPFARAEVILESKNCIQCHERGGSKGIAPVAGKVSQTFDELTGQSEAMIPPSLRAVGDKLTEDALRLSVAGKQKRRMDWLRIRMPRYKHTDEELETLAGYFRGMDRIPDGAPDPHLFAGDPDGTVDEQTLVVSNTLVGPKGFSCVACHRLGNYEPRNVALATRGSDLLNVGARMRPEFFVRWTRSPIRIVPGMEMPSIGHKPVPDILGGDIDLQLAALWKGLNAPGFTVPTDPASVEQFWTAEPGMPPRIVRDVFTLPQEAGGGYVARAFAAGFPNSHSVLFDLDRFELRQWTYGDFARQRTQGKSWYWDMAGNPIASLKAGESHFTLLRGGKRYEPLVSEARAGELKSYRRSGDVIELNYDIRFAVDENPVTVAVRELWQPIENNPAGWQRTVAAEGLPSGAQLELSGPHAKNEVDRTGTLTTYRYRSPLETPPLPVKPLPGIVNEATPITSTPGFHGVRLPLDGDIMPTAINWDQHDRLIFTSLKGHLYRAVDSDGDGLQDQLQLIEEGLAAPYGVVTDGPDFIVSHKPELLRLKDTDGDGQIDDRIVFADGWGYSDNYHDWTCGIARDAKGDLYVGLGSDYAQSKRPRERAKWRGCILRIRPDGYTEAIAHSFRYPTGLAFDTTGRLFATDNQGVQNTFNELNYIRDDTYYGVPSRYETNKDAPAVPPAVQIPHPWSRSINGIAFIPKDIPKLAPYAGHGIGCEYDSRFLIRFTIQEVDGVVQGAVYRFSQPIEQSVPENFVGPLSIGISPTGEIYIGSIHDSGWLGGQNTGAIEKLWITDNIPNGIRELTATKDGFRLEFFRPVDRNVASNPDNYLVSGYTRKWSGSYATEDSDRHRAAITGVNVSEDARTVELKLQGRREGFVYEVTCGDIGAGSDKSLWPATGHYTLHRIPK